MRRRLFGRSQDSSLSNSSKHPSPLPSPTVRDILNMDIKGKDKAKETEGTTKDLGRDSGSIGSRRARPKKSMDGGKHGERLSIFGGSFGGNLGQSRKPPPRYVF